MLFFPIFTPLEVHIQILSHAFTTEFLHYCSPLQNTVKVYFKWKWQGNTKLLMVKTDIYFSSQIKRTMLTHHRKNKKERSAQFLYLYQHPCRVFFENVNNSTLKMKFFLKNPSLCPIHQSPQPKTFPPPTSSFVPPRTMITALFEWVSLRALSPQKS